MKEIKKTAVNANSQVVQFLNLCSFFLPTTLAVVFRGTFVRATLTFWFKYL